jgi:DNA-binding CsgD family transcriptional regulator/PAS domain-containing protein
MTFHSRSVVDFGHLLNALTESLTDGLPVSDALSVVRSHFAADTVTLEIERRGREAAIFASSCRSAASGDASPCVQALMERAQHMRAATTAGADASYTLRVFRGLDAPKFGEDEQGRADVIVSQVSRAMELAARIGNSVVEKSLYSDVLDKLNIGVILVDASGRIASASAVAERYLGLKNGICTQLGKLRATSAAEDRHLQLAIREAGAAGKPGASRGVSLTKQSGARTLGVMVRPMPGHQDGNGACVAVYIRDYDSVPEVESEFVRQIFDLTPAEAAVTRRLTAGLSLEDAASSLDISRNTARAHLRSIFSKSGITRQTELVRLVLSSAALLGEKPQQAA